MKKRYIYLSSLCFIFSILIAVLTVALAFLGWIGQIWQALLAILALVCSYLGAFMVKDIELQGENRVIIVISAILGIATVGLLIWYNSFKSSGLSIVTVLFAWLAINRSAQNVHKLYKICKAQRKP